MIDRPELSLSTPRRILTADADWCGPCVTGELDAFKIGVEHLTPFGACEIGAWLCRCAVGGVQLLEVVSCPDVAYVRVRRPGRIPAMVTLRSPHDAELPTVAGSLLIIDGDVIVWRSGNHEVRSVW